MSKSAVLNFCGALVLVLLAGCASTPPELPSDWSSTNEIRVVQAPLTNAIPPAVHTNLPVVRTNLPPPAATNAPAIITNAPPTNHVVQRPPPVVTWTSLNRWAADRKIPAARLLTKSPLVTYAITSDRGTMVLAIGSHEAAWNGVSFYLGFTPEIVDGEVVVHGLDLQKMFEPLMCQGGLTFGSNRVVVIDPGHGGMNGGTVSVLDKRPEKDFTLDWARRMKPLLEANGWQVFLTRTNDSYVTNLDRVAFTEAHHADLFVSLHFNSAAPDKKENGIETYCLTPTGMPSTLTRNYADLWNERLPNNVFDAQNLQVAVKLHRSMLRATGAEDRGIRRARFMDVLRGQRRPAVLIEGGYLSNPHDAGLIASPAFRQKLAEAVANALK
ncbi:MAG TPA: N-acetylmuramoyl-L-alanine amidase [Verrucomicrobiae bacterium]